MFHKLNSDGSCIDGSCKAGGVIRDCNGKFIMLYSIFLGQGTSKQVEGQALLFGVQNCYVRRLNNLVVEVKSTSVCSNNTASTPWRMLQAVCRIKQIMEENRVNVKRCYRETKKSRKQVGSHKPCTCHDLIIGCDGA